MNEIINWPFTIVFFISLLGIIVSILLLTVNKVDVFHNRLLAGYLGCFSLMALNYSLSHTSFFLQYPNAWRIVGWTSFCFAPFGFLYVRSVLQQSFWFHKLDLLWFVPALIHVLAMVPFFMLPTDQKLIILEKIHANRKLILTEPESMLYEGSGIFLRIILAYACSFSQLRLLHKWRPVIMQEGSLHQNIDTYKWLLLISITMLVFTTLVFIQVIFHMILPADFNLLILFTIGLTILSICFTLFYKPNILYGFRGWLRQPEMIENDDSHSESIYTSPTQIVADKLAPKKRIYLSVEQGNAIRNILMQHFEANTPYRKTGFTISDLSNQINIPSYLLSAFINQEYGKNFNELVNEYRVDYFLQLIKQPEANAQYKLEALGKEAGFNTRASFIRAVKKKTGLTPSDFVNKKEK